VLQPATVVAASVSRLPCPFLLVTADHDPYGSAPAAPVFLKAARQARQLVTVPGADHGVQLVAGSPGTHCRARGPGLRRIVR